MESLETFSDERNAQCCIHCGRFLGETHSNRDHIPSRTLLREPYPENLQVVEVCLECNNSFSQDEEYVNVFLSVAIAGDVDYHFNDNPKIRRALDRNATLREIIRKSRRDYLNENGMPSIYWKPDSARVNRVVLKNAKAHAFYENSEIQYNDHASINFVPLQLMTDVERANFENTLPENRFWPEVGSRSMIRLLEGQDVVDGWVIVQSGVYRYAVILDNQHVEVRSVLFSYLATQVIWNSSEE